MTKVYQVVVYHEISNQEKLAAYAELAGPAMKKAGATFLARGIPYLVREDGVASVSYTHLTLPTIYSV